MGNAQYVSERAIRSAEAAYMRAPEGDGVDLRDEVPVYIRVRMERLYRRLVRVLAVNSGLTILANHQCPDAPCFPEYHKFGAELGIAVGRLGRVVEQARRK